MIVEFIDYITCDSNVPFGNRFFLFGNSALLYFIYTLYLALFIYASECESQLSKLSKDANKINLHMWVFDKTYMLQSIFNVLLLSFFGLIFYICIENQSYFTKNINFLFGKDISISVFCMGLGVLAGICIYIFYLKRTIYIKIKHFGET